MEKRVIKNVLKLIIDLIIISTIFFALSEHFYNSMENYFIDKINSLFGTSSISPFTTKVNLAASIICFIDVPYEIISIINKKETTFRGLQVSKYIVSVSLILTCLVVLLVIFPITYVYTRSFAEAFKINYLGGNLFTHIVNPALFVASFIFLEDKIDLDIKTVFFSGIPVVLYVFVYAFLVFIFKTWEDFYFIKEAINYITIFGVVAVIFIAFGLCFLFALLLKKIKSSKA